MGGKYNWEVPERWMNGRKTDILRWFRASPGVSYAKSLRSTNWLVLVVLWRYEQRQSSQPGPGFESYAPQSFLPFHIFISPGKPFAIDWSPEWNISCFSWGGGREQSGVGGVILFPWAQGYWEYIILLTWAFSSFQFVEKICPFLCTFLFLL